TVFAAHAAYGPAIMMTAFTVGLVMVFFGLAGRALGAFPHSTIRLAPALTDLLRGMAGYWLLALGSIAAIAAIWMAKWVIWFVPRGVRLGTGLVSALVYDSAMFVSYLVIIPVLGMFVPAIESAFFASYRGYSHAIRDLGPL